LFFFRDLLNISTLFRSAFTDEKRRFETRINQLEEELEEEQTNSELSDEKIKKLAMNYEQALVDISIERSNNEKLEVYLTKKKDNFS
jgi:myosin protein heavy chain